MKITEYPSVTELTDNNVFLIDGPSGTKTIAKSDLIYALFDNIPEMHNHLYRGKNLGTSYTASQKEEVSNGTFNDMWLGDYWNVGGNKWYICGFNIMGSPTYSENHIVIMGDDLAQNIKWDSTQSGSNMGKIAYTQSTIYKVDLPNYVSNSIPSTFKSNLYEREEYLVTAKDATTFKTTSSSWIKVSANVPRISNILGVPNTFSWVDEKNSWKSGIDPSLANSGGKFPIFNFVKPYKILGSNTFWLQDDDGPLGARYGNSSGGGAFFDNKDVAMRMAVYFVVSG